nr:hypothetical protein [Klebsiella pneumoniae subsp. pneumoniae]
MAGFISLLNTAGFALMLWSPHNYYTDILAMIIFGATIGALTCFWRADRRRYLFAQGRRGRARHHRHRQLRRRRPGEFHRDHY